MNVFLGSYGAKGQVNMDVDYIRAYNWPLEKGNELPNPGFEDSGSLIPWEGNGTSVPQKKVLKQYSSFTKFRREYRTICLFKSQYFLSVGIIH